jgi:hypothetical protein
MPEALHLEEVALTRPELLDDPVAHQLAVARSNQFAQRAGLVIVPAVLASTSASLTQYQTGFKSQASRGTCYAFAVCAAMEAAYKRKHGLELDLSEQFAFHLNKAGELYPDYLTNQTVPHENNSSYWGFQGSSDLADKLARAAIPEESAAQYLDAPAMDQLRQNIPAAGNLDGSSQEQIDAFEFHESHIPTRARHVARYRVTDFRALPANPTPTQVEAVLTAGYEVIADVPGHCTLIVGFDRARQVYILKNSWGENQFIELAYNSTSWPLLGGRYIIDVNPPDSPPQWDAFWVGRWQMDHDGWRGELVIRRTTDYRSTQGAATKLGSYYHNGKRYDVNGATAQNGQGLHFWIADTTDRVQPGAERGQEFWSYVFSWDPVNAAGSTVWDGMPYGVSLSRNPLPGDVTRGFVAADWLGTWALNWDGWRGALAITSVQPFAATLSTDDGRTIGINGGVDGNRPHALNVSIPLAPDNTQPFQLYAHTWEKTRLSGLTQWGGLNFGVQGVRTG